MKRWTFPSGGSITFSENDGEVRSADFASHSSVHGCLLPAGIRNRTEAYWDLRAECELLGAHLRGDETFADLELLREHYSAGKHLPNTGARSQDASLAAFIRDMTTKERRDRNRRKRERRARRGKR